MLKIILPESFILGAVDMLIDSTTISFVICPVAIINISVNMDESTFAVSSVLSPFSSIFSTVGPGLFSKSITESTFPLTSIDSTSFELVRWSLFTRLVGIVQSLRDGLTGFFLGEVFATA